MSKPFPTYTETPYNINSFLSNYGVNDLFDKANIVIPKQGMLETNNGYLTRIKKIYDNKMIELGKILYPYEDLSSSFSGYDQRYELWQTNQERDDYLKELEVKKGEKAAQRARNDQAYEIDKAAKAAKAAQNAQNAQTAKVAACRALIAEVDKKTVNFGGYRRKRMTKKRRNRKTKRSRK